MSNIKYECHASKVFSKVNLLCIAVAIKIILIILQEIPPGNENFRSFGVCLISSTAACNTLGKNCTISRVHVDIYQH